MPVSLDTCIADLFEPGNIDTDSGTVTTPHYSGYLLLEESLPPDAITVGQSSTWVWMPDYATLTFDVSGTWSGQIYFDAGSAVPPDGHAEFRGTAASPIITSNGSYNQPGAGGLGGVYWRLRFGSGSGTALVSVTGLQSRFLIEDPTSPTGVLGLLKLE
jgi:hypothetical protein